MFIPVVEKLQSSRTPWQVYQALYAGAVTSLFLDSVRRSRPDPSYSYLACDPFLEVKVLLKEGVLRVQVSGEENRTAPAGVLSAVLRKILKKYSIKGNERFPFMTGGAAGYWTYEMAALFDNVRLRAGPDSGQPWMHLAFFRDLIVFDHARRVYFLVTHVESPRRVRENAAPALLKLKSFFAMRPLRGASAFQCRKFRAETSRPRFESMVRKAKTYIRNGDIYQANLSQKFSFTWEGSPISLYGRLRKINPSPFASFLKFGALHVVSSSPERLVSKRGNLCETKPIAGTRPRIREKKRQSALRRELLANEKERAEHLMLVDLERNDLGRVCEWKSVKVEEMMKIETYSHVTHIVSRITGRLKKDRDALDLLHAMFPGGTITGCPKIRCMEIIDSLEKRPRGLYTGSLGYIDFHGDMDLNILIRTIVLERGKGSFQVGAGIVHDSNPGREYEETLHKGEAMAQALLSPRLMRR